VNIGDGKLHDVLVEKDFGDGLRVWADPGMESIISSIQGVTSCIGKNTAYDVYFDPRYDIEWIMQEIIARVKIGEP